MSTIATAQRVIDAYLAAAKDGQENAALCRAVRYLIASNPLVGELVAMRAMVAMLLARLEAPARFDADLIQEGYRRMGRWRVETVPGEKGMDIVLEWGDFDK